MFLTKRTRQVYYKWICTTIEKLLKTEYAGLANPNTLKSPATVTLEQVLGYADMEEFIRYYAKDKISKMKRGSVKTFIKENKQISDLNIFTDDIIDTIESILQIRHLYAHSNGIIDEKFLRFYKSPLSTGSEYILSMEDTLAKMDYLINIVNKVDKAAVQKYALSTL